MRETQETDSRRLAGLGFDWRDCPRCEMEPSSAHPLNARPGAFRLDCGRQVRSEEIHQHAVYASTLAGIAPSPPRFVIKAVERAEYLFPTAGKPIVLPPRIRFGSLVTD